MSLNPFLCIQSSFRKDFHHCAFLYGGNYWNLDFKFLYGEPPASLLRSTIKWPVNKTLCAVLLNGRHLHDYKSIQWMYWKQLQNIWHSNGSLLTFLTVVWCSKRSIQSVSSTTSWRLSTSLNKVICRTNGCTCHVSNHHIDLKEWQILYVLFFFNHWHRWGSCSRAEDITVLPPRCQISPEDLLSKSLINVRSHRKFWNHSCYVLD